MESLLELGNLEFSDTCDIQNCGQKASYICDVHKDVLLWKACKVSMHYNCDATDYLNPKILSKTVEDLVNLIG